MILQEYVTMFESNTHLDLLRRHLGQENLDFDFSNGKLSLSFVRSHNSAGVQLADVIAGACTRRMNWLIGGKQGTSPHLEESKLLGELHGDGVGLNIVSTARRVHEFFSV